MNDIAGRRILVTGANGCIGAWVVKLLSEAGADVRAFDLGTDEHRHRLVNDGGLPDAEWVHGDLTSLDDVLSAGDGVDRIIHLAALQIPFCRANPSRGAAVNVTGTVHVFEAARTHGITQIAQASSIAVYGGVDDYPGGSVDATSPRLPRTLYGVYKVACEDLAKVYWAEHGVRSVGLRPHTVFGPGRDQGMTSLPSVAIERAVERAAFHIDYGGVLDFQYAPDVARAFIHAAVVPLDGAPTYDIAGHPVGVDQFLDVVRDVTGFDAVTCGTDVLPVVERADGTDWSAVGGPAPTPLADAIDQSARIFARKEHD
jgi:nucleoside-diphosphate-sugar epimerase